MNEQVDRIYKERFKQKLIESKIAKPSDKIEISKADFKYPADVRINGVIIGTAIFNGREFELEINYTVDTVLDAMRAEYPFSPAAIKDIAEELKTGDES